MKPFQINRRAILITTIAGLFSTGLLADDRTATLGTGATVNLAGRTATVAKLDTLPLFENDFTKRFKFDSYDNPKLKQLREQYKLDGIVSPGKDELIKTEAAVATPRPAAEAMKSLKAVGAEVNTEMDGFISIWFPDKARLTDAEMPLFLGLSKVRGISLDGMPITDAGLVYLAGFTDLRRLSHN